MISITVSNNLLIYKQKWVAWNNTSWIQKLLQSKLLQATLSYPTPLL